MSAGARREHDDALEELLAEFVDRRERGERLTADAFCAEHPEREGELRSLLRELSATEDLFPSAPVDVPARIGPYRITGEIGRGGMGRVLAAVHDDRPGEELALKILHAPFSDSARTLERFRREGRALKLISHPGIVRVLDTGVYGDRPYIAMERVEGTSLMELLVRARTRSSTSTADAPSLAAAAARDEFQSSARIVAEAARALAAAHAVGVLHRDLNPRNVLVRADGRPVVIDFGLMRSEVDPTLTGSGDVLGTPQYMAPEQARGEKTDERTDVFGLGMILFELLSRSPPRESTGALTLLRIAGSRPIPRVRRVAPNCPRDLATITYRATAFAPHRRYSSAERLADDLERWLAGERIEARGASIIERSHDAWLGHRVLVSSLSGVALVGVLTLPLWRGEPAPLDPHLAVAAVAVPWLDGDLENARARFAEFQEREPDHALVEFLAAACANDFNRGSERPAARALIEGERAMREGRALDATKHFATASDVAPGHPLISLLHGIAEVEAGAAERAREKLEGAAFYFGGSHRLHRALAAMYTKLESWPDVSRALQAALALVPNDAEAWILLAQARAHVDDAAGAAHASRRALKLAPVPARAELESVARFLDERNETDIAAEIRAAIPK